MQNGWSIKLSRYKEFGSGGIIRMREVITEREVDVVFGPFTARDDVELSAMAKREGETGLLRCRLNCDDVRQAQDLHAPGSTVSFSCLFVLQEWE